MTKQKASLGQKLETKPLPNFTNILWAFFSNFYSLNKNHKDKNCFLNFVLSKMLVKLKPDWTLFLSNSPRELCGSGGGGALFGGGHGLGGCFLGGGWGGSGNGAEVGGGGGGGRLPSPPTRPETLLALLNISPFGCLAGESTTFDLESITRTVLKAGQYYK